MIFLQGSKHAAETPLASLYSTPLPLETPQVVILPPFIGPGGEASMLHLTLFREPCRKIGRDVISFRSVTTRDVAYSAAGCYHNRS